MRIRVATALLALAAAAVAVLVAIFLVRDALGDGDPASDYLISGQLFVSFKASLSRADVTTLRSLLDDSKRKGFPLKVAVIAGPDDLGSIPSLFGKPQRYASFLGQEDYNFFKDELLVVMPQGFGLFKAGGLPPGDRAAVAALPAAETSSIAPLIAAAKRAVEVLASRHNVTLSAASTSTSHRWRDRLVILAGVFALGALAVLVRLLVRHL